MRWSDPDPGPIRPPTPSDARTVVGEMRRGLGWSDKDKIIFAAGVAGAAILGAIIVFV